MRSLRKWRYVCEHKVVSNGVIKPCGHPFLHAKSFDTHRKLHAQWIEDGPYDNITAESAIPPDHIRRREEALARKISDEACDMSVSLKPKDIEPDTLRAAERGAEYLTQPLAHIADVDSHCIRAFIEVLREAITEEDAQKAAEPVPSSSSPSSPVASSSRLSPSPLTPFSAEWATPSTAQTTPSPTEPDPEIAATSTKEETVESPQWWTAGSDDALNDVLLSSSHSYAGPVDPLQFSLSPSLPSSSSHLGNFGSAPSPSAFELDPALPDYFRPFDLPDASLLEMLGLNEFNLTSEDTLPTADEVARFFER